MPKLTLHYDVHTKVQLNKHVHAHIFFTYYKNTKSALAILAHIQMLLQTSCCEDVIGVIGAIGCRCSWVRRP